MLCLYVKMLMPIHTQLVAECVKHFERPEAALESIDGFRYLIWGNLRSSASRCGIIKLSDVSL